MSNPKKVRFDGLDCTAVTTEIRSTLLGSKLANIYDGQSSSSISSNNTSTYLLKLVQPVTNSKIFLLIESGIRFHLTESQTKSTSTGVGAMPSPFVMKLRKCLNNKRLESITQLGKLDRVVDLRFGSGKDGSFHLILELYAKGNLILTKHDYEIVALLRSHEYNRSADKNNLQNDNGKDIDRGEVKVAVGQVYPVTFATTLGSSKSSKDQSSEVNDQEQKTILPHSILDMNETEARLWIEYQAVEYTKYRLSQESTKKKKKKKHDSFALKMALLKPVSGVYHYGPALLEHCILSSDLNPNLNLNCIDSADDQTEHENPPTKFILDPELLSSEQMSLLLTKLKSEGKFVIDSLTVSNKSKHSQKGYILYKSYQSSFHEAHTNDNDESKNFVNPAHSDKLFLEFQPHLLHQHNHSQKENHIQILEYSSFSEAVDHFFSQLDIQRRTLKAANLQSSAQQKLANIQADQSSRMEALEKEQADFYEDAQWIEQNADIIDDCILVVNSALDSGMDWEDLEHLVEVEQTNGNPVASLIHSLDLENDSIVLELPGESGYDADYKVENGNRMVKIGLDGNAFQNARIKYQQYRQWKEKAAKTQEANIKALQAAEQTVQKQLIDIAKNTRGMNVMSGGNISMSSNVVERKPFWFEKFRWFITSDNYLVLAGRDAHQNEILVKRYLRPGDAYLHADVFGASSCILRAKRRRVAPSSKNKKLSTKVLPLSEQALREAGHFTICNSSAWSTKMITSAWYVEAHQVSKTAPSGEYLTVGSFMVRGKKNYLQPVQLEMGLGVLFVLGDATSMDRHRGERRDFSLMDDEDDIDDPIFNHQIDEKIDMKKSMTTSDAVRDLESSTEENNLLEAILPSRNDSSIHQREFAELSTHKDIESLPLHGTDKSDKVYSLESEDVNDENGIQNESQGSNSKEETDPVTKKKKGISVKERKLIKKYGSLEEAEKVLAEISSKEAALVSKRANKSKMSDSSHIITKQSRGKKNKAKKAAKKYAEQDDEDRELAILALHGSKDGRKGKKGKKKSSSNVAAPSKSLEQIKAAEETLSLLLKDTAEVAYRLPEEVRSILSECVSVTTESKSKNESKGPETVVRWDKFDAEVLEKLESLDSVDAQKAASMRLQSLSKSTRIDNFAASLAGILRTIDRFGYEHLLKKVEEDILAENLTEKSRKNKAEKQAEKEVWQQILAEDGILASDNEDVDEDEAVDDTSELAKLTAKPLPEDIILCAVPVCAPYHTLSQYKYRIKLTPGSLKRGKAAKQCLDILSKANNDNRNGAEKNESEIRNGYLIKYITHNELVQTICGEVKISAPGASKLIKNSKKNKGNKNKGKKKK